MSSPTPSDVGLPAELTGGGEVGTKNGPRAQQVVEILRTAIISERFEPGDRLIESALST